MTRLLALFAALLVPTALAAAAPRPWTAVATPAATGSYLIGNPKARVKLVEYVSYTCPHCAHLVAESGDTLKSMVRSGSTSVEVRNQVHDKLDLVAATVARCAGPAAFPRVHEALFAQQQQWIERGVTWDQANSARMSSQPELAQLRALADGAGIADLARTAGAPPQRIAACFATDAALNRTLEVTRATAKVRGTPAFEINGRYVEGVGWAQLEPMLRAAGAR